LQLLAPVCPHITEEIYQTLYREYMKHPSIHVSPWPKTLKERIDEKAEHDGDLIVAVINAVRRDKAEKRLPLNTPIKRLTLYAHSEADVESLRRGEMDIAGTCKAEKLEILNMKGEGKPVEEHEEIRFKIEY